MATIDYSRKYLDDGVRVGLYIGGLDLQYSESNRTATFALYESGNYTPIEVISGLYIPPSISDTDELGSFSTRLSYNTNYTIGCTIYMDGSPYKDLDTVNVYFPSMPKILSAERKADDPWTASVTIDYNPKYISPLYITMQYWDGEAADYIKEMYIREIPSYVSGVIALELSLRHIGKCQISFSNQIYYDEDGDANDYVILDKENWGYEQFYIDPIPINDIVYDDDFGFHGYVVWKLTGLVNEISLGAGRVRVKMYRDGSLIFSRYLSETGNDLEVSKEVLLSGSCGESVLLCAEIYDEGVLAHTIYRVYNVPSYYENPELEITALRDADNPNQINVIVYLTTAYLPMTRVRIYAKKSGEEKYLAAEYEQQAEFPMYITLSNMGTERVYISIDILKTSGELSSSVSAGATVDKYTPPSVRAWTWEDSNGEASQAETINAYNAIELKMPTANFSYLVWNDLIEKIRAAYRMKNGGENTAYENRLNVALMSGESAESRTLTAEKFNNARTVIGSILSTFNVNDNEIYNHYINTGSWNMAIGEKVCGAYIKALTDKLNEGIGGN